MREQNNVHAEKKFVTLHKKCVRTLIERDQIRLLFRFGMICFLSLSNNATVGFNEINDLLLCERTEKKY